MEFVERWFYPFPDPPKRIRKKPMQVLALGMSRSGTESLRRALQILGYDHVYHGFDILETSPTSWKTWTLLGRRKFARQDPGTGDSGIGREDFEAILGHCEAVTDQPCALFATDLVKAYPEAKVILNYRDVDAWYESVINAFVGMNHWFMTYALIWFHPTLYWMDRYAHDVWNPYFYGSVVHHGKWVYEEHSAKLRGLVPAEKLLEWRVEDGWEPLCRFLDKPIPSEAFPSGNRPMAMQERYKKALENVIPVAIRKLFILVIGTGALGAYVIDRFVVSGGLLWSTSSSPK